MKILGQSAIVTGGLSGLGAATVAALVEKGAHVVALDLPDADTSRVPGEVRFVDYLRQVFQWGGFPGWEQYPRHPKKLVEKLTGICGPSSQRTPEY